VTLLFDNAITVSLALLLIPKVGLVGLYQAWLIKGVLKASCLTLFLLSKWKVLDDLLGMVQRQRLRNAPSKTTEEPSTHQIDPRSGGGKELPRRFLVSSGRIITCPRPWWITPLPDG
jgi:hypothetical protein